MIDPDTLKILAATCSVIGSGLLAWRVKGILDALRIIATAHEANIQQLMPGQTGDIVNFDNSTAHLERAQGTWLLALGFLLLGISGALNLWALAL